MTQHGRHAGPPARRPRWFHGGMVLLGIIGVLVAVVETTYSSSGPSVAAPLRQPTVAPVATVRAAPAPKKKPVKKVIGPVTVRVATFNLLGCGFTWNNGHPGSTPSTANYAPCEQRFGGMWNYINSMGHSIVGFEEVQAPVQAMFRARTGPGSGWGMYPTTTSTYETAILWRTADWHLIKGEDFRTPFFASGNGFSYVTDRAVLLQYRNGRRVWVMVAHHAPSTSPNWSTALGIDLATESDLFRTLLATHVPVLFLADTNDTSNKTLCAFQAKVPSAHSIYGPANCANPGSPNDQNMDKIIGSDHIDFNGVFQDWSVQKARITDHGSPSAYATISDRVRTP